MSQVLRGARTGIGSVDEECATSPRKVNDLSLTERPEPVRGRRILLIVVSVYSYLVTFLSRLNDWLRRMLDSSQRLVAAFLSESLTAAEKSLVTVRLYDGYSNYRNDSAALYPWEEKWFQRRLPKLPTRILVGACGAGREAVALAKLGFEIDAFEPAPELFAISQSRLGNGARVQTLRYEELSSAVLESEGNPVCSFARERYEAVLLGYGSLTHVLDPAEQSRLIKALNKICPDGPILASFFATGASGHQPLTSGRAARWGSAFGRKTATLRGIPPQSFSGQSFGVHSGFAYSFTRKEIEQLGALVGREVVWEYDFTPVPHVTFLAPNKTT